jgi:integrase
VKDTVHLYQPTWRAKDGALRRSRRWWLDFADAAKRRWRLPGLIDKRATEALARRVADLVGLRMAGDPLPGDMLKWLEQVPSAFRERLAAAGLIDRDRVGGLVPLLELDATGKVTGGHLADFLADCEARGVSPVQRRMLAQRCRDMLERAGCRWARDLSAARIQAAIAALGEPTQDRPGAPGLSKQSLHHYRRALGQFSRWLHRERRTAEDALVGLRGYNAETDRRLERRGFTPDEMTALLASTRQALKRWGMTGPARAAAYALAFASGLRRNEIKTLTRASFDLGADPLTVTVEAGYSKHRRRDVQPLPADVAAMLADFLATADPDRPFPLPDKTGEMLHGDMAEARAAWVAQGRTEAERQARKGDPAFLLPRGAGGLVLDFHSFRHGYVTAVCRANISPRVMMELARHSDPRLTMKRYSRVSTADTSAALAVLALPRLSGPDRERATAWATGTDDARAEAVEKPGPRFDKPFDRTFDKTCGLEGTSVDFGALKSGKADAEETLAGQGETAYSQGEDATSARSSVGESGGFLNRRSQVRILSGVVMTLVGRRPLAVAFATGCGPGLPPCCDSRSWRSTAGNDQSGSLRAVAICVPTILPHGIPGPRSFSVSFSR